MGRPAKFTYDDLARVADEIAATGKRPTMRLLRTKLGGSDTSVHAGLKRWEELHPETASPPPELPQTLLRAIASEFDRVSAEARGESEERRREAQDEAGILAASSKELETERDALLDQVELLTAKRDQAQVLASEREQEIKRLNDVVSREQSAAEAARTDLAKALLRMEDWAARLQEQVKEIARLRSELDAEHKAREAAEKESATLAAKLEAEREARADAVRRETNALAKVDGMKAEIDAVRSDAATKIAGIQSAAERQIQDARTGFEKQVANISAQAEKRVAEVRDAGEQKSEVVKVECDRLRGQVSTIDKALVEERARATGAETKSAILEAQIIELKTQITELKNKVQIAENKLDDARETYQIIASKAVSGEAIQDLLPKPKKRAAGAQLPDR